ncbi:uncharacterized protein LOC112609796 [Theropithecus gelada]|uniref:uncharacterized protein LOC112609796 n=1 Tax=Theropithecus gelada TaxID=9565 RepID=UPI000DC1AED7|nr:uncharacterized protein LOC112609796 [Theropithecus gelada]
MGRGGETQVPYADMSVDLGLLGSNMLPLPPSKPRRDEVPSMEENQCKEMPSLYSTPFNSIQEEREAAMLRLSKYLPGCPRTAVMPGFWQVPGSIPSPASLHQI